MHIAANVAQKPGIYRIVNTVNGYKYIGSAISLKRRYGEHRKLLVANKHHSRKLQHAYNKYGAANFVFEPILFCEKDFLIGYEQSCFDMYEPEYNIAKKAGSTLGVKHTREARLNNSKAQKLLRENPEFIAKLSNAQKANWENIEYRRKTIAKIKSATQSPDARRAASDRSKAIWQDPVIRDRIIAARKAAEPAKRESRIGLFAGEKHPMFGKKHTAEALVKMSESHKARMTNDAVKSSMSKIAKALWDSPEYRQKNSEAKRVLSHDQVFEIRRLIGEGMACSRIATIYGVGAMTINRIKNGKQYIGVGYVKD